MKLYFMILRRRHIMLSSRLTISGMRNFFAVVIHTTLEIFLRIVRVYVCVCVCRIRNNKDFEFVSTFIRSMQKLE